MGDIKLNYRPIIKEDYPQLVALTDKYVNSEQAYRDYMKSVCDTIGENSTGICALDDKGTMVGVILCEREMHLTGGREDFFARIKEDIGSDDIWSGSIIVVEDEYRNKKIGAALLIHMLSHFEDIGAKHLLLEIWVRPDGYMPSNANLATAGNYTEYGIVKNFYAGIKGYICPVCGTECKCSAKIAVVHI